MAKITVISPVYNNSKYLRKSIESVLNQTFKDFEYLIVDDCSTDNSVQIIEEYAAKDSRIRLIKLKKNKGQGYIRNMALKKAQSDYVIYFDADDFYEPDAFELLYKQITKNNNEFVMFKHSKYDVKKGELKEEKSRYKPFENILDNPHINLQEVRYSLRSCFVWVALYKKEFLIKNNIKFGNYRLAEDVPFVAKTFACGTDVSIINKNLYTYNIYETSSTFQISNKHWLYIFKSRRDIYKEVIKIKNPIVIDTFLRYYIRSVLNWFNQYTKFDSSIKKDYYDEMHKDFRYLKKHHNIEKIKDEIDYEKFIDIAQNSWNKKHNILFEFSDKIKIYKNKNSQIVISFFNKYKFTKIELQKNMKKFIQGIFSIKNIGSHKVFSILFVKIKTKRKTKG